jgi:hypothetical protein
MGAGVVDLLDIDNDGQYAALSGYGVTYRDPECSNPY